MQRQGIIRKQMLYGNISQSCLSAGLLRIRRSSGGSWTRVREKHDFRGNASDGSKWVLEGSQSEQKEEATSVAKTSTIEGTSEHTPCGAESKKRYEKTVLP